MDDREQSKSAGWGVLLMSTGCPSGPEQVQGFIRGILSDRDVMNVPFASPLGRMIAFFRRKKVIRRYESTGGFSRLAGAVDAIAARMRGALSMDVKAGYRYVSPSFHDAASSFKQEGIGRIVAIALNPQYSISTNGSFVSRVVKDTAMLGMSCVVYSSFSWDEAYVKLVAGAVSGYISSGTGGAKKDEEGRHVLFVAHSVPVRNLGLGDPYVAQVEALAEAVSKRLGAEGRSSLAYQSAVGPMKWVGPEAKHHVAELAAQGVRSLVVVPLSFVVENLETLYDLDIELKERVFECGIRNYIRVPTIGESEAFSGYLCGLVSKIVQ
ncbi:MAG: ferrochelatase [Pseudomonadota bacterium]